MRLRFGRPQAAFVALATSLAFLILGHQSFAGSQTVGAEFELTNLAMSYSNFNPLKAAISLEHRQQLLFAEQIRTKCEVARDCEVETVQGKYINDFRVVFPDGWYFQISIDPGCIEIQTKPSTTEELERQAARIDQWIFAEAKKAKLYVRADRNGHVNIGVKSAFGEDPGSGERFMRFFIDYANHPDLALGGLGMDLKNAPPLSALREEQREALQKVIEWVRLNPDTPPEIIAKSINKNVYYRTNASSWGGPHYQAFGMHQLGQWNGEGPDVPFEMRAMWAQSSALQLLLATKLIETRIRFVNSLAEAPIYLASRAKHFSDQQLVSRFYVYVVETGLSYEEYKPLLKEKLRDLTLDAFFRPEAPVIQRLRSAKDYLDLVLISPRVQKDFFDLMARPEVKDSPVRQEIILELGRLANQSEGFHAEARKFLGTFHGLGWLAGRQRFAEKEAPLWKELHGRVQSPAGEVIPMCELVFP